MQSMNVITSGEQQNLSNIESTFTALPPANLDEDLDFDSVRTAANKAQKKVQQTAQKITSSETRAIPNYIRDMVRYIKKYAANGRFKFEYDCTKLSNPCFLELAKQFKEKYPAFFVVITNAKVQILTVDWSGKSEV